MTSAVPLAVPSPGSFMFSNLLFVTILRTTVDSLSVVDLSPGCTWHVLGRFFNSVCVCARVCVHTYVHLSVPVSVHVQ